MELEEILDEVYQKLIREITEAYYNGNIGKVLKKYELEDKKEKETMYFAQGDRILVIGQTSISKDILNGVAKTLGFQKNQLDYELDYEKLTNYNFGNLRYTSQYTDILVGPVPHKTKGIENYKSFLSLVESNPDEFPKITRLETNNELKITKTTFKNGLMKAKAYLNMQTL